jgi:hypothetical protein
MGRKKKGLMPTWAHWHPKWERCGMMDDVGSMFVPNHNPVVWVLLPKEEGKMVHGT